MPGRGCKYQITVRRDQNENRGVYRCPLCSRDSEGRDSTPYPGDKQYQFEDCCSHVD
jgi:hypothetical protein